VNRVSQRLDDERAQAERADRVLNYPVFGPMNLAARKRSGARCKVASEAAFSRIYGAWSHPSMVAGSAPARRPRLSLWPGPARIALNAAKTGSAVGFT
jgi:hypothetical protein